MNLITRRSALLAMLSACVARPGFAANALVAGLVELERASGGRLGVCALETVSGRVLFELHPHERFAMCSTFKLPLVAAILAKVDAGAVQLTQQIAYTQADLLSHAPVTAARVAEGSMSVGDLCAATIKVSDNTAANLLLPLIDGPGGLTKWLRSLGDRTTRLDRIEPELNSNLPKDERDTTTPHAMAQTMVRLLTGTVLSPASLILLNDWLVASETGRKRIRHGLPSEWRVGDKTGTGNNSAVNDVAIVWPPQRSPVVITVYMSDSPHPIAELEQIHAHVGALLR